MDGAMSSYTRITLEERQHIHRWKLEGLSQGEIARRLRRSPGSISRELARNTGRRGYRPVQANWRARERSRRPGPRRFTAEVRMAAELKIREGWTPDIISHRFPLEGKASVCKETIYQHIYADARSGGDLWTHLPRARRKRRRRCPRVDGRGRGRIPNQRMIDTRPASVETRSFVGHWEGDLINGAHDTGNLVTLVERKTRYTCVGRTDSKESLEVLQKICMLFESLPARCRHGLTLDNGKEFSRHEELARVTGMDVYFARPYHSWERGTNENTNGLIRRLHPKKSSFAEIDDLELARIDAYLNDRPRMCLDWQTPREALTAFLAQAP